MNTRRSFFAQLAAGIATAVVAPQILTGCDFKWKVVKRASGIIIVNPAWINAPLEIRFMFEPGGLVTPFACAPSGPHYSPKPGALYHREHFPTRMTADGKYIHPIIEI